MRLTTILIFLSISLFGQLDPDRAFNYEPSEIKVFGLDDFEYPSCIRGIRNNNWGNIELGAKWFGKVENKDERFVTFADPIFGLRAILRISRNYYSRYGINTVDDWANRWAPPFENNTNKYTSYLVNAVGTTEFKPYDYTYMKKFTKAVCEMENGKDRIGFIWHDWYFNHAWIIL